MRSHQETTRTNLRIRGLCPGEYPLSSGLRPIIRGKVKTSVEFGAKLDLSIDEKGYARIETISFHAYNESTHLQEAIIRYYERTGSYPERVLVDQIYRTRANRNFCKDHGIRISGPKLGRPGKPEQAKADKKQEYEDNTDRIEIEREFSVEKRSYGLGLIVTRLETTQLTSIALSVLTANLFKMQRRILCAFLQFLESCKRDSDLKIHLLNFIGSRKEFSICT